MDKTMQENEIQELLNLHLMRECSFLEPEEEKQYLTLLTKAIKRESTIDLLKRRFEIFDRDRNLISKKGLKELIDELAYITWGYTPK